VAREDGVTVTVGAGRLSVAGDVDIGVAGQLRERLASEAERAGSGGLVLDISGVSFIDCSGLRAMMVVGRQVEAAGGRLVLAGPSPVVSRLVDLLGLSETLPVLVDA
jgi:anti-sigma B factor antagonist